MNLLILAVFAVLAFRALVLVLSWHLFLNGTWWHAVILLAVGMVFSGKATESKATTEPSPPDDHGLEHRI